MADCFTEERFQLMRALGAEVESIPSIAGRPKVTAQDIHNMVARAAELAAPPGHYATDQFNNPYIIPGHRDRLGQEIWDQTGGACQRILPGHGNGELSHGSLGSRLRPHGGLHPGA